MLRAAARLLPRGAPRPVCGGGGVPRARDAGSRPQPARQVHGGRSRP